MTKLYFKNKTNNIVRISGGAGKKITFRPQEIRLFELNDNVSKKLKKSFERFSMVEEVDGPEDPGIDEKEYRKAKKDKDWDETIFANEMVYNENRDQGVDEGENDMISNIDSDDNEEKHQHDEEDFDDNLDNQSIEVPKEAMGLVECGSIKPSMGEVDISKINFGKIKKAEIIFLHEYFDISFTKDQTRNQLVKQFKSYMD